MKTFNRDHGFPSKGTLTGLPPQAIPTRKKDRKWKENCMDALEAIGLRQVDRNQMYRDYYLMAEGKLSFMELADVIPQLKDIQTLRENVHIPSFLKHYDLIGGIVNAFEGWLTNLQDKYTVNEVGDMAISEYEDTMTSLLRRHIQEQWDIIVNQRLVEAGLDPEYNNFESDEERQAYAQKVQQAKVSMTPEDIQRFMTTRWKTQAAVWGDHTIEADRGRFYMDEMDRENFRDFLLTGKMCRNHFVGFDYYRPEVWSPMEVFHPDVRWLQHGSYVGRIHYYEGVELIARYGHKMTPKDKRMIMGGEDDYAGWVSGSGERYDMKKRKFSVTGMYENQVIPWEGYHDYASIVAAEDYFGVPMGERHSFDGDGKEVVTPRFLPRLHPFGYFDSRVNGGMYSPLDPNLYRVMEGYWVSMKPVFLITYMTETGMVSQEMVTDELLPEFLEQNGIKKVRRVMADAVKDPEVNTYILEYVPEVRYGVKITGGSLVGDAIYIGGDPIPHQIHGDSSLYDYVIPVSGYVGTGLADRIQPYQMLFNLSLNQLYNNAEKEIGKFFLGDIGFLGNEYKDSVDKQGVLATFMQIVKSVSFMATGGNDAVNPYTNAPLASGIHNNFGVYDLTNTDQIKTRMDMASYAYMMAYRMIGISEQAMGASTRYESSTGVKQGVNATMLQTQTYFNAFDDFKKRTLDIHLAVAQMCQKEGYDWTVMYRNSDLSLAYVSLTDDSLALRHLNVLAVSNSKKRLELENLKQYLMQTNTLGNDLLDITRMMGANSTIEMVQIGRDARAHADKVRQENYQNEQSLLAQKEEAEQRRRNDEHEKEKELAYIKGNFDLRGKSITAAGQAARTENNTIGLEYVESMADRALKERDMDLREEEIRTRQANAEAERKSREDIELRKLELKEKEIAARNKRSDTDRFTSIINKN